MSLSDKTAQGLLWCFTFVILDAAQAVYLGNVLQKHDAFLLGGLVFGLASFASIVIVGLTAPTQIKLAGTCISPLVGMNVTAAGGWLAYFFAIQLLEPAVVFTIFSGMVPLTIIVAARLNILDAHPSRNKMELLGNLIILLGLALLVIFTLTGRSGFVRGGLNTAIWGLILTSFAGVLIALMLLFSKRLDRWGMKPLTQFGFRFPLFTILAFLGFLLGVDQKAPVTLHELLTALLIGLLVLAFPIYAVQKAVALTSALTIGSIAALSPLIIFLMQLMENRVEYSAATMTGLSVFFCGAIVAALGSTKAVPASNSL